MKANKAVFDKKETQDLDRIIHDLETRFKKPTSLVLLHRKIEECLLNGLFSMIKGEELNSQNFSELHEFWLEVKNV